MILVDTSYLIALTNSNDALHPVALAWSSTIRPPLVVTEYVLLEVCNFLSTPGQHVYAAMVVDSILNEKDYEFIASSPELLRAALAFHARVNDKRWSLTDCASFYIMHARGMTQALTFDHHFVQAGFQALLRSNP